MSVDWITVIAQVINFLILVWLLKRFLYRPVIEAMQRREQRIAERLTSADQRESDAEQARQRFESEQAQLAEERSALLEEARSEVERQKKEWLDEARAEIQTQRDKWHRQIQEEQTEFLAQVRRRGAETLVTLMNQALGDLADRNLESAILSRLLTQLNNLEDEDLGRLVGDSTRLTVRSRFDLGADDRNRLSRQLHDRIGRAVDIDYEQAPELIGGIELVGDGQRLSWNLADYMDSLNDRIAEMLSPSAAIATRAVHHA
ncbi:F0F1 ATP synthase subunit B family protein [Saccharospirillum salsuginis]|uniref:ATP synthase subunit b n=1 Tax=Saccharospirillum salsuginis TaxID=418750 RepID=A0A918KGL4_9GAMM|nr:hypothetical protein [Saccharospirillum salsuginis]GGX61825.1 ATP synthase subunit B [Saccharospirillum salsuginis]